MAFALIDWHDFVVVETIDITEADEKTQLALPMSITELENMSIAQKSALASDIVGKAHPAGPGATVGGRPASEDEGEMEVQ